MELDPWVSCPYKKEHRVPLSRIQAHIVKCEKKHPPYEICPYNATHRLPEKQDMKLHVQNCPSREAVLPEDKLPKVSGSMTTPKPIMQKDYLPETDPNHEIWD